MKAKKYEFEVSGIGYIYFWSDHNNLGFNCHLTI